jgi:hypothetical protein
VDDDVRRLLRDVAEDQNLPTSTVSDSELLEKCRAAPRSARDIVAVALAALRRALGSLGRGAR